MASIGIDLGTTSIKVCLVKNREILVERSIRHGAEKELGKQDAETIIKVSLELLKEVVQNSAVKFKKVRIAGQMHGIVGWNSQKLKEGTIVASPLYTWMFPNEPVKMDSLPKPSRPIFPGFGAVTLLEKELFKEFDRCGTIMDLFYCYLCQLDEVRMSWQLAESFGYCSHGKWDKELVETIEKNNPISNFKFPEIVDDDQLIVGRICPLSLKELENIEVLIPLGDLQASIKSVADDNLDAAYLILGTSSQICIIADRGTVVDCLTVDTLPYSVDKIILAGRSMNGGNAIDAFLKLLTSWSSELTCSYSAVSPSNIEKLLETVDNQASCNSEPSSRLSPTVLPTFIQERGLSLTGASLTGLDRQTSLVQIINALCSGVVDNLLTLFPLKLAVSLGIKRLYLVGNAKKARFSRRIEECCKEVGINAVAAENDTSAAYGAAIF